MPLLARSPAMCCHMNTKKELSGKVELCLRFFSLYSTCSSCAWLPVAIVVAVADVPAATDDEC